MEPYHNRLLHRRNNIVFCRTILYVRLADSFGLKVMPRTIVVCFCIGMIYQNAYRHREPAERGGQFSAHAWGGVADEPWVRRPPISRAELRQEATARACRPWSGHTPTAPRTNIRKGATAHPAGACCACILHPATHGSSASPPHTWAENCPPRSAGSRKLHSVSYQYESLLSFIKYNV